MNKNPRQWTESLPAKRGREAKYSHYSNLHTSPTSTYTGAYRDLKLPKDVHHTQSAAHCMKENYIHIYDKKRFKTKPYHSQYDVWRKYIKNQQWAASTSEQRSSSWGAVRKWLVWRGTPQSSGSIPLVDSANVCTQGKMWAKPIGQSQEEWHLKLPPTAGSCGGC